MLHGISSVLPLSCSIAALFGVMMPPATVAAPLIARLVARHALASSEPRCWSVAFSIFRSWWGSMIVVHRRIATDSVLNFEFYPLSRSAVLDAVGDQTVTVGSRQIVFGSQLMWISIVCLKIKISTYMRLVLLRGP